MTHPTEQVATVATTQRLARLLQAGVAGYPAPGGYLDTLPGEHPPAPGRAQAAWQTGLGATLYQHLLQPTMARLLMPPARTLASQLGLEAGHTVADVGCGPGNITTTLADAVGPHGLALGIDRSAPMLERAASQARPTMGLLRADATRLPLETASVDAACATAVVMLVPEPAQALAELLRIVKPGGPVLVMVPGRPTGRAADFLGSLTRQLGQFGGARLFTPDELAILLEQLGCRRVHTAQHGTMLTAHTHAPQQGNQRAAASTPPNTAGFDAFYRGDYRALTEDGTDPDTGFELDRVPWDIGEAQPALRELETAGAISSEILDIGCGPGDNALYLAERGYRVTAVDGAPAAIEIAQQRAKTRQLSGTIEFDLTDATELAGYTDRFATVLDSALYHCLTEDQRHTYLRALHRACQAGARLHLLCFSDRMPEHFPGPYRITEHNLRETLPNTGWTIQRLESATYTTAFSPRELPPEFISPHTDQQPATLETDHHNRLLAPAWLVTAQAQ